jgi:hypothetical protein
MKIWMGARNRSGDRNSGPGRRMVVAMLMVIVVVAAAVVVLAISDVGTGAVPGASASPQTAAVSIVLSPKSGGEETSITVKGSNFAPSTTVDLTFGNPHLPTFNLDGQPAPYNVPYTVTTNSAGGFSTPIYSGPLNKGTYEVLASDGSVTASATYKITSSPTTLKLSSVSVAPGACVKLKGTGFYPGDVENLYVGPWPNSAGFKTLKSFPDTLAGAISHKICTYTTSHGAPVDWAAGTYAILVVGDTFTSGSVTLTVS